MTRIVLTADRALFTDFNGVSALGFGLCVPYRLIPDFIEYRVLAPSIGVDHDYRARIAPYPLAKIESSLHIAGFKREDVLITPPRYLSKVVDKDTVILGIHVLDPQGLAPVSWTLSVLLGGGKPCTQYEFEKLMKEVLRLKSKYRFKVIVGGPGAWQLRGKEDHFGIDVLFEGEGELTFPLIAKRIIEGKDVPRRIHGEQVPPEAIPPIITPSRNGTIEITRGCPRRCRFCSPTMRYFRSIPLETILREIKVNLERGVKHIGFSTEDIMLYGANGLHFRHEAIARLFSSALRIAKKHGVNSIGFSHVTLSSALAMKKTVKFITEINGYSERNPAFPQVGLESGSPRIVREYFGGKPYPWRPDDWPSVVIEGAKLLNEHYWYPCLTYLIGYPDARPDDYVKTTELLERLKEERFIGWVFPLLLIPMGGTMIEKKARFKKLYDLSDEAIECIVTGWEMSLDFARTIYPRLLMDVKNVLARKIIFGLINKALSSIGFWIDALRKNRELIIEKISHVNIRTPVRLIKTIVKTTIIPNITMKK